MPFSDTSTTSTARKSYLFSFRKLIRTSTKHAKNARGAAKRSKLICYNADMPKLKQLLTPCLRDHQGLELGVTLAMTRVFPREDQTPTVCHDACKSPQLVGSAPKTYSSMFIQIVPHVS